MTIDKNYISYYKHLKKYGTNYSQYDKLFTKGQACVLKLQVDNIRCNKKIQSVDENSLLSKIIYKSKRNLLVSFKSIEEINIF